MLYLIQSPITLEPLFNLLEQSNGKFAVLFMGQACAQILKLPDVNIPFYALETDLESFGLSSSSFSNSALTVINDGAWIGLCEQYSPIISWF